MGLKELRDKIDITDSGILSLFLERMNLCREVAEYKKINNMPVFQGGREQEVIDRIKKLTGDSELENGTAALFTTIMDISKILQNRKILENISDIKYKVPDFKNAVRIGCQGTSGANSETAAKLIFGDKKPVFYKTFEDVFRAVRSGEVDYGVLPVHNTTAGTVTGTYDLMVRYPVYIVSETDVEINHCLAVKNDISIEEVKKVYSHPQALAQCYDFLTGNHLKTAEYSNTALAAEKVSASDENIAAICSVDCAEKMGLHIIAKNIADCSVNRTKFICIANDIQAVEDADVVSVMLKIPHIEGSLYRLLTKFYVNGMNLIRLENRPIKDGSFDAWFYLDFSGNLKDPSVKALICDLKENLEYFRILGTFKSN